MQDALTEDERRLAFRAKNFDVKVTASETPEIPGSEEVVLRLTRNGAQWTAEPLLPAEVNRVIAALMAVSDVEAVRLLKGDRKTALPANAILEGVLEALDAQIEAAKPTLSRTNSPDNYIHGWRNGAFFTIVAMRHAIKGMLKPQESARSNADGPVQDDPR